MVAKVAGSVVPAGLGAIAGLALMVPTEAGIPIPIPADLVMLAVGARVGAGDIPLWIAVLAFEAVSVLGTTALFLAARGPGHALPCSPGSDRVSA
jgi:membrane protein DedA with SNARE-associated domain